MHVCVIQCRGSMVVAGYLHAGKERRREGVEICADNPAHGQSRVRAALEQRSIGHAKSDAVLQGDACPIYHEYARLFWPGPLFDEDELPNTR